MDEKARIHPQLRTYKALTEKVGNIRFRMKPYVNQTKVILASFIVLPLDVKEKEIYRWPIRESLKSMLAMGWTVDRARDGESMSHHRDNEKLRKISQASQV